MTDTGRDFYNSFTTESFTKSRSQWLTLSTVVDWNCSEQKFKRRNRRKKILGQYAKALSPKGGRISFIKSISHQLHRFSPQLQAVVFRVHPLLPGGRHLRGLGHPVILQLVTYWSNRRNQRIRGCSRMKNLFAGQIQGLCRRMGTIVGFSLYK